MRIDLEPLLRRAARDAADGGRLSAPPVRSARAAKSFSAAAHAPRVGFVAPSGYLPDPEVADRAAQYFASRGWSVCAGETVFARELRFAGPDDLRASELQRFATDPSVDLVVAARGGYGLSRILPRLDFGAIARAGRPLVGYSDFTAFGLALLAKAGAVSFQGPSAADFGPGADREFTQRHFFEAVGQPIAAVEFEGDGPDLDARGRLWGGNLTLTCAMLGTPYFPRVRGGILFLEDVNEAAYRIERMLLQLLHAGVLGRQRAIVLGDFAPVPPMPNDNGFDLAAAVGHLRARLATPLFTGLPFGHGARRVTLPVGATGRLTARGGKVRVEFRGHPVLKGAGAVR
jgi:muramoyltetrapeptide carboxypeptidase